MTKIDVFVPSHCGALNDLTACSHRWASGSSVQKTHPECRTVVLVIQCHKAGILWRELYPLLIADGGGSFSKASKKALILLLRAFYPWLSEIDVDPIFCGGVEPGGNLDLATNENMEIGDGFTEANNQQNRRDKAWFHATFSLNILKIARGVGGNFRLEHTFQVRRPSCMKVSGRHLSSYNNTRPTMASNLLLVFLPPYPTPSTDSPLRAEQAFSSRLVGLENQLIRLQSLNAFIATLGGGFFLCHHLSTAVRLARSQRQVALVLGNEDLAGRCTVNEAYNYIHAGFVPHALKLIKKTKMSAIKRGDSLTVSMCKSARLFGVRVARAAKFEEGLNGGDDRLSICQGTAKSKFPAHELASVSSGSATPQLLAYDNFHRIRIVKDKSKRLR